MKKFKIKQHIPSFCSGIENQIDEFSNLEELKNIKWVKECSEIKDFYRFSISDKYLMVEYNKGYVWYVLGHLDEHIDWLPEWKAKYEEQT